MGEGEPVAMLARGRRSEEQAADFTSINHVHLYLTVIVMFQVQRRSGWGRGSPWLCWPVGGWWRLHITQVRRQSSSALLSTIVCSLICTCSYVAGSVQEVTSVTSNSGGNCSPTLPSSGQHGTTSAKKRKLVLESDEKPKFSFKFKKITETEVRHDQMDSAVKDEMIQSKIFTKSKKARITMK